LIDNLLRFGFKFSDFEDCNATSKFTVDYYNGFTSSNKHLSETTMPSIDIYKYNKRYNYDVNSIELLSIFAKKCNNCSETFYNISSPYPKIYNNKNIKFLNKLKNLDYKYESAETGLHFDAGLIIPIFEKKCIEKNIHLIDDEIIEFNTGEKGINKIICKKNIYDNFNYIIDCSGFKRLTSKTLNNAFLEDKDLLLNSAIPTIVHEEQYYPYTKSYGYENGWYFNIPLRNRTGMGFLFSNKINNEDSMINYIKSYFNNQNYYKLQKINNTIKWTPGKLKNVLCKNVFYSGLSFFFYEPIGGNTHSQMIYNLYYFKEFIQNNNFNINDVVLKDIDSLKNLVLFKYHPPLNAEIIGNYWKEIYNISKNNEHIKNIISSLTVFDTKSIKNIISQEASLFSFIVTFLGKGFKFDYSKFPKHNVELLLLANRIKKYNISSQILEGFNE